MSDNEFITEIIETQEAVATNIELLADEVGADIEKGASPEEQKIARQKAALFGGANPAKKEAADDAPAETAAALLKQNQANLSRVARAAGVSSQKLADGPNSPERKTEALLGGGGSSQEVGKAVEDMDPEEQEQTFLEAMGS